MKSAGGLAVHQKSVIHQCDLVFASSSVEDHVTLTSSVKTRQDKCVLYIIMCVCVCVCVLWVLYACVIISVCYAVCVMLCVLCCICVIIICVVLCVCMCLGVIVLCWHNIWMAMQGM